MLGASGAALFAFTPSRRLCAVRRTRHMDQQTVTATPETPLPALSLAEHIAVEEAPPVVAAPTTEATPAPDLTVTATPEQEADSVKPDAELSEAGKALRKGRLETRIERLRELNEQLRINKELRAPTGAVAPPQTATAAPSAGTTTDPEPDPKAYPAEEFDPAYHRDLAKWTTRQELRSVQAQTAERVTHEDVNRQLEAKAVQAREKYSDFDAVIQPVIETFTNNPREQALTDFVRESSVGGEVLYALAKDAHAMAAIASARSPVAVVRELVRLEARLLEPAKAPQPQTTAPAPPSKTVGSGPTASHVDTNKHGFSTKEHARIEQAEIDARRRQGLRN